MSRRTLWLALALCLASNSAAAMPVCLLTAEPDSSGARVTWWSLADRSRATLTLALAGELVRARLKPVPNPRKIPTSEVHARYKKWPLDPLDAVNLAAVFSCRLLLLGEIEATSRGKLPILGLETMQLTLSFTLLAVDSNKTLAVHRVREFGFAKTQEIARKQALRELGGRVGRLIERARRSVKAPSIGRSGPLLHVAGLATWKQLQELRSALAGLSFVQGSSMRGFRRGELTLQLVLKKGAKTYDTADTLSVELGRLKLPGAELAVKRGKDGQVWVNYRPTSLP